MNIIKAAVRRTTSIYMLGLSLQTSPNTVTRYVKALVLIPKPNLQIISCLCSTIIVVILY